MRLQIRHVICVRVSTLRFNICFLFYFRFSFFCMIVYCILLSPDVGQKVL